MVSLLEALKHKNKRLEQLLNGSFCPRTSGVSDWFFPLFTGMCVWRGNENQILEKFTFSLYSYGSPNLKLPYWGYKNTGDHYLPIKNYDFLYPFAAADI